MQAEACFFGDGQVWILVLLSEEVVMVCVVFSKGDGGRDAHGNITNDGEYFVGSDVLAARIVDEVMD